MRVRHRGSAGRVSREGLHKDRLPQCFGALQRNVNRPLVLINGRELFFEDADDLVLFGKEAKPSKVIKEPARV